MALGFSNIDLASSPLIENIKAGLPKNFYECHTLPNANGGAYLGSHFYAYNDRRGDLMFQFDYLDGQLLLTKTTINLNRIPVEQLFQIPANETTPSWTYWALAVSIYDTFLGVVVSSEHQVQNGLHTVVLKIGIGNQPQMPTAEFKCAPQTSP